MLGTHYFYWQTLKHYIVAFGTIFTDMHFKRPEGDMIQVPLSYSPVEKMLARLEKREGNQPDKGYGIALTLPRMGFEITSIYYDSSRALNKVNRYVKTINSSGTYSGNPNRMKYVRAGAPYNIEFQLTILTKFESDISAMLDIILPMFKPEQMISVHIANDRDVAYDPSISNWQEYFNSGVDIVIDTPVLFNHMNMDDSYDGDFETRRTLQWTLSFTMKAWFLGAGDDAPVIKLPQSTIDPEGIFKYIPYTVNKNWAEITIDDADNIEWYTEFTSLATE